MREGEEAVLNLSEAGRDFLIGGTGGLVSSTPRLFDISLDAYGDKIVRNENNDAIQILLGNLGKEKRSS
ncbi:MAG: hypothetical protein IKL18_06310 [Oscillospiraceae bacterium]|nr:hypothetical protein [Oscillospiraceae bacterium]